MDTVRRMSDEINSEKKEELAFRLQHNTVVENCSARPLLYRLDPG
jgi:hypothetical protein